MRSKKRIPIVMKFFKNNKEAFKEFAGDYHRNFLDNYEEIFYEWVEYQDYRFGQLLINLQIIPDGRAWNIEESDWLIEKEYIQPEEIITWGTYGLDGEERMKKWVEAKPKFKEPLDLIDKWLYPGIEKQKNYEVYARRYNTWMNTKPQPEYRFIKDLDADHISNILAIPKIAYRKVFEKVLLAKSEDEQEN